MPQSTSTAPQERVQPWKAMQEVQNLFKPEVPAAAETADKAEEEEHLNLNLLVPSSIQPDPTLPMWRRSTKLCCLNLEWRREGC
ncbi:uncharacterized protein AKAW2_11602A [Aspergillus luchuensis]|uniref:Uncharacterized protein n=1 Tax=Aspergillus kawachii TaxID=1069201 RepID=A0A7R7W1B1_ASPKA|nr:uncharacterized protein AKAW2_11602A [Aspergillus luchuensis]BCR94556.1 hypothetical protein AKAW2_11602A [Aspergillus luchuensis]GAA85313.1 hypothetical protein AKAW_03427 [Aspergillus luchuensis IFO 4308]